MLSLVGDVPAPRRRRVATCLPGRPGRYPSRARVFAGAAATVRPAMSDPPPPAPPPPPDPPGAAPVPPAPGDFQVEFDRVTRSRRWPVALLGLMVIAALVLSAIVARSASSGDGDDGDDGGGAAPGPTTTLAPATEAEIDAAVAEISAFVERESGVEFIEPVTVELEDEGGFQQRLLADFDEDADDLRRTEVFLEGLGLVDPDVDLVEAMRALLGGGVVGFYDPETDELVVRGAALTPYVRTTIAHELVHALDDQHHDLDRPEHDDADDEIGFGFSALVEGNARRVESAYRDSLSDEERRQAAEEEVGFAGDLDLAAIPPVLLDLIGAPYVLGEPLVRELVATGGDGALAAAYADPPRTSEQVMDPARYADREPAVDVPVPEVPGEVIEEGVIGQLLVLLVLAEALGMDEARAAAVGWGGDRGVAWRDGDRSCATATLVGDDVVETEEMRQAFERWAEATEGARVEAGGGGGPFTVESCAG